TARPPGPRIATRIVLDSQGRLPASSQLVRTAKEVPVLVATVVAADELVARGCEVVRLPGRDGKVDLSGLLQELGRRRMTNVLVEGGAATLGAFLDAGAVDEVHAFIAPVLLGGELAKSPVGGRGVER